MLCTFIFLCYSLLFHTAHGNVQCDQYDLMPNKLKDDLICSYDETMRPVRDHQKNTTVSVRLILKYFEYDVLTSTLRVDCWVVLNWKDEHVVWTPKDYGDIKSIHLSTNQIWVPDISVYNGRDQSNDPSIVGIVKCLVNNEGFVTCVPSARIEALCVADVSRYPFDQQNCTLRLGSWVHSGEEIHLVMGKPSVSIEDHLSNGEWELVSIKPYKHSGHFKCCPNNTYPSLNYNFVINRLHGSHSATIIIPAIAIIIVTLTSLWLSPLTSERMTLCCVNIVIGFMYIQYVSWKVPLKGDSVPYLVLFARDSLLLCSFTIFLTMLLKNLVSYKHEAPIWINWPTNLILSTRPGQWIFLNDSSMKNVAATKGEEDGTTIIDNSSEPNNPTNTQDWIIFAKVVDRSCFIIYCIVYIIMFISYAP